MVDIETNELSDLLSRLASHDLHEQITTEDHLRLFMSRHVFCVWDFQSLICTLQAGLGGHAIPWLPMPDPESSRLVNELILEEQTDRGIHRAYESHFDIYRSAMVEVGADTQPIDSLVSSIRGGTTVWTAIQNCGASAATQFFVEQTMNVCLRGAIHEQAAVFTLTREDLLPRMFIPLVAGLSRNDLRWSLLREYLERHIESDGERHGPLSRALLDRLCENDPVKWNQAHSAAIIALRARLALWDEIRSEVTRV